MNRRGVIRTVHRTLDTSDKGGGFRFPRLSDSENRSTSLPIITGCPIARIGQAKFPHVTDAQFHETVAGSWAKKKNTRRAPVPPGHRAVGKSRSPFKTYEYAHSNDHMDDGYGVEAATNSDSTSIRCSRP